MTSPYTDLLGEAFIRTEYIESLAKPKATDTFWSPLHKAPTRHISTLQSCVNALLFSAWRHVFITGFFKLVLTTKKRKNLFDTFHVVPNCCRTSILKLAGLGIRSSVF